jgi:ADP-ribose pyrophosphatase
VGSSADNRACSGAPLAENGLKREGSSIIWQGSSWRLRAVEVLLGDGTRLTRGAIEHPGSVVLVPVRDGRQGPEVLMLRQYRFAIGETILELPAGTRGWDEEWLSCAQRELREETGYRAEQFKALGQVWPAPGLSDELMKLFLATDLKHDPLRADMDEIIELQPMPLLELISMAEEGRLQDGKSIVGILRAANHLAK